MIQTVPLPNAARAAHVQLASALITSTIGRINRFLARDSSENTPGMLLRATDAVLWILGHSDKRKVSFQECCEVCDFDPAALREKSIRHWRRNHPERLNSLLRMTEDRRKWEAANVGTDRARRVVKTVGRVRRRQVNAVDVDLFEGRKFDPFIDYKPAPDGATQKQVNFLLKLGVKPDVATAYTFRQAGAVIDSLKAKQVGAEYRMTFGQHEGKRLADVPASYIEWIKRKRIGGEFLAGHIRQMEIDRQHAGEAM
ncbi:putative quorum-sensing-regulated virulence factor [Planctomicrobium sp. SH661]|uniref:putative quorum-sensing-regulated virulence factor n=1 Tax=Planctomicrobium sp. SH661 TaxID=3448124 RepID=UPI003F5CB04C